ncbi:hypothetical protein NQ315_011542 [Exocentrus adspersus]|uniref:Peptidase S1 domain-containing protein n=1 Tax=Exocentrus adspersus TaxID=1586481 RepID=A0AAV8VV96_9CUCU|nr:hypothetical protein NQ315_011542 [Exocentrus adspersus]
MFNSGVVILAAVAVALCAPKAKRLHILADLKRQHPQPDGRIVGGDDANIENYPYQLSLLYHGDHMCGASIIAPKWAVTAAHCTDGISAKNFKVRAGSTYHETGGQLIKVKHVHQHPGFDMSDMDFDISILELQENIKYTNKSSPIKLVDADQRAASGAIATVTGWGLLDQEDKLLPSHLQVVKVPVVSVEECEKVYGPFRITDRMLCAGFTEGGRDSCQGDSGGPLVLDGKLAGVVSWGYGCAVPKIPGVYTDVATLRDFVADITKI